VTDDPSELDPKLRAALDKAGDALEEVYDAVASLDPSNLTVKGWQEVAAHSGVLLAKFDTAAGRINRLLGLGSARSAILQYLRSRVGETVRKEELRGVAAIYEWARRVRELRVEQGWPIETGTQQPDLSPSEYVLVSDEPDEQLAADWQLAKRMRNLKHPNGRPMSAQDRGLEYLKALSPRAADKDQLTYVMNISSHARRIRELDEYGWQIVSNVDDPSLAPGSYRMVSLERRPPRVREAIKLRHHVLERDQKTCQDCARTPKDRVPLQIHHKKFVSQGGDNSMDNLVTLCSDCHAGRHSLARGTTKDELLDPGWFEASPEPQPAADEKHVAGSGAHNDAPTLFDELGSAP